MDPIRLCPECAGLRRQVARFVESEAARLKALSGELANAVMHDRRQFHGGIGCLRESPIERRVVDARILSIGGGATEVIPEEVGRHWPAGTPR